MRKLVFCLWLALVFPVAADEIKFNFGNYTQTLTNDFTSALAGGGSPGNWKVVTDEMPSAFTPFSSNAPVVMNHISVLSQEETDPTDERFPILFYNKENFKDFALTTQFKIISGVAERMAGIVFRYQNASNFYVIRASALGHNLRFYKVVDGIRGSPVGPPVNISTGVWHSLAIRCEGNRINCWLDGNLVMPSLQDSTFDAGKIGFWTKSDSLTHFGSTTITYTPVVPMVELAAQKVLQEQPRILDLQVYALDKNGTPKVIASKVPTDMGLTGTASETGSITNGATFFGRGKGTVTVTMPLTDRNGDPIAAVKVKFKSFLGETRDNALMRARFVVQAMQAQVLSGQDLTQ